MKELTLEDLSREELLAWIKMVALFRVRQADLLSVRHSTLSDKYLAAMRKYHDALDAEGRAMMAWHAWKGDARQKNLLDRIYLDQKDATERARRAMDRADREQDQCWAAIDAEWSRERSS
ncbi:hypothetical protein MKI84_08460 [Ancylobacter sp. A5.8]|uniref:hypothetical protein n=1 Tax=Ancylobacter gelatini TaxID=2919920 RepID=UPI001F4EAC1F|nr:hypothetical protein [Ancylobacter gelatini]MCJ8142947.1 hypothetical protein [Ancylobacter gelatini]